MKNTFLTDLMKYAEVTNEREIQMEKENLINKKNVISNRKLHFDKLSQIKLTNTLDYYTKKISTFLKTDNLITGHSDGSIYFNNNLFFKSNYPIIFSFYAENHFFIDSIGNIFKEDQLIYKLGTRITSFDYHKELKLLLCSDISNKIYCIDINKLQPIFKNDFKEQKSIKIHKYGNIFLCNDNDCNLVDLRSMNIIHNFSKNVTISSFLGNNDVICCIDNQIICYDLRFLEIKGRILSHKHNITSIICKDVCYTSNLEGELCISSPQLSLIHKEMKLNKIKFLSVCKDEIAVIENNIKIFSY
ncbi:hypothetical protein H312_01587 [Anncaliia algerae PRA339]|uniref:Uncharacterized protein n=1 Tax=Anncaliia algerae PRA339 TaxID=1288291 RepID=A0A059F1K6_9MICR|nr:hypothetical protein H312_01587 [Anncaliia algerae PRA339]